IHASFSEDFGTYEAHFAESRRTGIDRIWWTEHDWRMSAWKYVTKLSFTTPDSSNTTAITYAFSTLGSPVKTAGALVRTPVSPQDPGKGAVHLRVTAPAGSEASTVCEPQVDRWRLRSNLAGELITLDVLPKTVGPKAALELVLTLGYHPPRNG